MSHPLHPRLGRTSLWGAALWVAGAAAAIFAYGALVVYMVK